MVLPTHAPILQQALVLILTNLHHGLVLCGLESCGEGCRFSEPGARWCSGFRSVPFRFSLCPRLKGVSLFGACFS